MTQKPKQITPVIFRKFKEGNIIAIFPDIAADYNINNCLSYQHIGQHGSCSLDIILDTVLAKHEEYKDLAEELTKIDYTLKIVKKCTAIHRANKQAQISKWNQKLATQQ